MPNICSPKHTTENHKPYKGPRAKRLMPELLTLKEMSHEHTPYCDKCGIQTPDSVGLQSQTTGLYICVKCLSGLTIADVIMLAGKQFDELLKEIN